MGYTLETIIARPSVLEQATFDLADSKIVRLTQEFALLPVTQAFYDSLAPTSPQKAFANYFTYLSQPLARACAALSEFGMVAYVEADFFVGVGQQTAIVWDDQRVIMGPVKEAKAINQALKLLGVKRGLWTDEFDVVDLGRHRETIGWLSEKECLASDPEKATCKP